jgi:hypothetical protein
LIIPINQKIPSKPFWDYQKNMEGTNLHAIVFLANTAKLSPIQGEISQPQPLVENIFSRQNKIVVPPM